MLTRLYISNIALIDKSDIAFDAGFSALTGETGAGKSILIESVSFVLGDRASRENIRTGAQKAVVEAEFVLAEDSPAYAYLKEHELDDGETLVLYRELSVSGRNVCRINGTPVTAGELKQLGDLLVDLHGQHAHQSLLNPDTHLSLIDAYLEETDRSLLAAVEECRNEAQQALKKRNELKMSLTERMRRIDTLTFQCKEIDAVAPVSGEEETLEQERNRMRHAETITEGLNRAYASLFGDGGALQTAAEASRALSEISAFDAEYETMQAQTDDAYYGLEDVAYRLRDARNAFSYDPNRLEEIETRLSRLQALKRKYGATVEEVLAYREGIQAEREALLDSDNRLEALEKAYQTALYAFGQAAESLSKRRQAAAERLCKEAVSHLKDMGMKDAKLTMQFTLIEAKELHPNGIDAAEFLLSANRGEPLKPLVKVASGGEISRIMLALKVALTDADRIDTLIFDEIDTGISGMVANAVAKKMRELGKKHQVLCVTHLPQIAAHADAQYVAYKYSDSLQTHSITKRLDETERVRELARIMGSSEADSAAMEHAAKLLKDAKEA